MLFEYVASAYTVISRDAVRKAMVWEWDSGDMRGPELRLRVLGTYVLRDGLYSYMTVNCCTMRA